MHLISNFITDVGNDRKLSSIFPMISVSSYNDFFIECDAYDVIISINNSSNKNSELSIIEMCVLRLLAINSDYSDEEISEKLCLGVSADEKGIDTSFVKVIRARLIDTGVIERNGALTSYGYEMINGLKSENNEEADTMSIRIFAIRQINNKLLLFIDKEESNNNRFEINGKKLTIKYGTTGKEKTCRGEYLYLIHDKRKSDYIPSKAPKSDDVRKLISNYNKKVQLDDERINIARGSSISISPVPSSVIIHMKAVLQRGNVMEPIITDGFSINIDDLYTYLAAISNSQIISKLYEKDNKRKNEECYEEKIIKDEYKEIYVFMKKTNVMHGNNLDTDIIAQSINTKLLENCYAALEWTFHYYLTKSSSIETTISIVEQKSSSANMKSALEYANEMGLNEPIKTRTLSCADKINIYKWRNGIKNGAPIPDMKLILPLSLIYAHINNEQRFKRMAAEMPDFLNVIEELHSYAASSRHEGIQDVMIDKIEMMLDFVKRVISFLLPDVILDNAVNDNRISEDISKYLNNCIISVANIIGWDTWSMQSETMKMLLLDVSEANDSHELYRLSSTDFVLRISQILELLMYDEIKMLNTDTNSNWQTIVDRVSERLNEKLPESFSYVNTVFLQNALNNMKTTLNPMVLVYLCYASEEKINQLKEKSFPRFIAEISEMRGHGNTVNFIIDSDKRREFRNKLFEFVKIIGG